MNQEPHTLAGAYALQSLNDLERRRFERHLARCSDCAEELRELRETTARLALASDRPAPPTLRAKVFAEIEHTRLEPLPGARTYQFWFMGPGAPRSAGTLTPGTGDDGGTRTLVSPGVGNAQQIGVTVEPGGGSRQPTTPLVLGLPLG